MICEGKYIVTGMELRRSKNTGKEYRIIKLMDELGNVTDVYLDDDKIFKRFEEVKVKMDVGRKGFIKVLQVDSV